MYYTDKDGEKKLPYIIHRTSLGCYERTLAYLIETYAGALPLWLSPVQVKVMPISETFDDYAKSICDKLTAAGLRAETDLRSEKIGFKIREAQLEKIPYMIVVGEKEQETGTVSVRTRNGETITLSADEFVMKAVKENADKVR